MLFMNTVDCMLFLDLGRLLINVTSCIQFSRPSIHKRFSYKRFRQVCMIITEILATGFQLIIAVLWLFSRFFLIRSLICIKIY